MEFNVTSEQWIDRFAMHLSQLEVGAEPGDFLALAHRLFGTHGHLDPVAVADDEFAARLETGAAAVERTRPAALDSAPESSFERTERIPVERLTTGGEYVRDNDEWIARCLRRVLELDPIIRSDEASRSVNELAGLERWRLMKPEAAAEQLYTPIRPNS
ncbi:MAG: hypothetical protein ABIZ18_06805 [Caldimonas sp.]